MRSRTATLFLLAFACVCPPLTAEQAHSPAEPEQDLLPIGLTEEEMTRLHEIGMLHITTEPPSGDVRNPAEWEPSEGVLVRWPLGIPVSLVAEMSEDVVVTTIVANSSAEQSALNTYSSGGVNMANIEFLHASTNSIWVRDYGPWFIFENDRPAIVDHVYNRPRPLDDVIPQAVGSAWGLEVYGMDLRHTGGNHMSDGLGTSSSTELVYRENTEMSHASIDQVMFDYLGNDYMVLDYIQSGGIHHIDCWAKFLSPTTVLVKDVPPSDSTYDELNARADSLASQISPWGVPYEVYRVYCPSGTYYTNSLILNDKVLVPLFGSSQDSLALQAYEEAMPGYEVLGFTGSWASEDALHCRAMGVPDRGTLYIDHVPFRAADITTGDYEITTTIVPISGEALLPDELKIHYSVDGGVWEEAALTPGGGQDEFVGLIPAQPEDSTVSYYLEAADNSGRVETHPYVGLPGAHGFTTTCNTHPIVDVTPDGSLPVCPDDGRLLTAQLTGGAGPFTYQWLEDGIEIPGADSATYYANGTGTHSYNCRVSGIGCSSFRTDLLDVTLNWQAEPVFAGIEAVTSPGGNTCTLDLEWSPATAACGGPIYYDVHRATAPFFTPGPDNLVVGGLAGTSYRDGAELSAGTHYYYAVRARDDSNGVSDNNLAKRFGSPGGTCTTGSACTMTVNVRPNGQTLVCDGEDIVFTASPSGGVPPYEYQWTKDGLDIPGAIADSYVANHESAQSHTYNCKVTDSALCANVVDGLNAGGVWSDCSSVVTVPNGTEGTTSPLLADRVGDALSVSWDATSVECASVGYHVIWGWGADLGSYAIAGAECGLDTSGSYLWTTTPDTSSDWMWFLVVGNDGGATEGGWGTDASSAQRSLTASGECATILIDTGACL